MNFRSRHGFKNRLFAFCRLMMIAPGLACASCYRPPAVDSPPPLANEAEAAQQLQTRLDQVLQAALSTRQLDVQTHGAWQVLHGVLAFGPDFPLQMAPGQSVPAVDYLLQGGRLEGWTFEPGEVLPNGRRGLRAIVEAGTKRGQGHEDQWLAILAQCNLPLEQAITLPEGQFALADYLQQVQRDVPFNVEREWSWTLIGLSHYLPSDASWTARDGKTWTVDHLVRLEAEQELDASACGGTHRLIGIAMALQAHDAQQKPTTPNWELARDVVARAVQQAQRLQNGNGSFSSHYFARGGQTVDLAQDLSTSGHILEFLALALTDQQLSEPWVARATIHLCDTLERTAHIDLECGSLYHALHGLVLYRQRLYGPFQPLP